METCQCEECLFKTEIAVIQILCCDNGVHKINILPFDSPLFQNENISDLMKFKNEQGDNAMNCVISWLKSYFASSLENIKQLPPVCSKVFTNKGDFTVKVWKALMHQVTFGQTLSYSELAALSGNRNASRAVGSAMKNNCIPLIIPCHRVIKADGKIGHFSCGKIIKEWLLKHEKAFFKI